MPEGFTRGQPESVPGPTTRRLAGWARRHACYITGEKIASTDQNHRWVGAVLPVGERLFETDFHVDKMRQIEQEYGAKVRVTWYHDDDLVTLASLDPQLTVDDLIHRFQLTPHTVYIRRAQKPQDACRKRRGP